MKWSGLIGYYIDEEVKPDIWQASIKTFKAKGNMRQISKRSQTTDGVIDAITLNNELELIANPFINDILYSLKYVTYMNAEWKITNVRVQYPKIYLTLGDVYNGQKG